MTDAEARTTSTRRGAPWWPVVAIAAATAGIYFWRLAQAPVYIGGDEARFGAHAYSIASTGRDLDGRWLPLFFRIEELNWWYQPTLFYLVALTLKILPLGEFAIRVPTAAIGVLDVCLLYAVVRRMSPGRWYAAAGAIMLALTPAHLLFSRQARDFICLLPYVLGWLWCLVVFMETDRAVVAGAGGLLLGAAMYSHIAGWIVGPVCLFLTMIAIVVGRKKFRLAVSAATGFAIALLPLLAWVLSHPEMPRTLLSGYRVYDARRLGPLQGVKDFLNYNNVQERLSVYWDYWNPAYLFFSGGANLAAATRRAGVFAFAAIVLLPAGVYDLWQRRRTPVPLVLLLGLALAPVGAMLVDDRYAIQRELVVVPFGVLASASGLAFLWTRERAWIRAVAMLLLLAFPLQFVFFYRDYLTEYQRRSAYWFDPGNFGGVADFLVPAGSSAPAIYISNTLDDALPRWQFYLAKSRRLDLWSRTHFFSKGDLDVAKAPIGSLIVFGAGDPEVATLTGNSPCCAIAHRVPHASGDYSAVVLRRTSER